MTLPNRQHIAYFDYRPLFASGELTLVDLRSPKEFFGGAACHAVNLPIFDDDERHQIGWLYKNSGPREAVYLGLDFFAARAAPYLEQMEALAGPSRKIAVYCWRGGMRSTWISTWLAAAGFDVYVVKGGYKGYRAEVLARLDDFSRHQLLVLHGRTGSGKTDLLRALPPGFPLVDFEKLAVHRGSALGKLALPEASPTQQNFENSLADAYHAVGRFPEILVEIEDRIGSVALPKALQLKVKSSPMILVTRDTSDRVARLVAEYTTGWNDRHNELFAEALKLLAKRIPAQIREELLLQVQHQKFAEVALTLLKCRYDPVYDKSLERYKQNIIESFDLTQSFEDAVRFLCQRLTPSDCPKPV